MRKWLIISGSTLVVAFLLMQLVPYRVTNPPVVQEPKWDSPRTRQLAVAACYDCHSNETHTTWLEDIAPLSWWITNHVREGRDKLNFSEWGSRQRRDRRRGRDGRRTADAPELLHWFGMHGDAKLTPAERKELADGLRKTLGGGG